MKKVFVKTYGCQMNVYDSERIVESLSEKGFTESKEMKDSDVVVFNTCHIREKAAEKLYSDIGRLKENSKTKKIVVAGCVAQAENQEIIKRMPDVDLVIGPQSYHKIPDLISKLDKKRKFVETDFPTENKFNVLTKRKKNDKKPTAFLTIQEGCDKFCTFCVVPYTRGAEYSRTTMEIIEEAKELIGRGISELTLLGQNVNAYHGQGYDKKTSNLADLFYELSKLDGLKRLRYTTNHPNDVNKELIQAHKDIEILMPYIHLPIQSGSDRMLKLMNRKHTRQSYLEIIEKIREARCDIAISSDFIVGFPGETDSDFEQSLSLINKVNYSQAYSFTYSPRPGTPAADYDHQLPKEIKMERLIILQNLLKEQQLEYNKKFLNSSVSILIEREGKEHNQLVGKSPHSQSVYFNNVENKSKIGNFAEVHINSVKVSSLSGNIIEKN
ncbi:MAG: tRNA (N6-isopentenyl adenosine(37)-C2)-methylthiotransferase MiaB [Hyphomicrobiales bacterium]|nr:tRNA (N6-isopentenyl adenosine(37)-C2)-methylthiotransferase MiaB [Hyphomicrobiales bacterium]